MCRSHRLDPPEGGYRAGAWSAAGGDGLANALQTKAGDLIMEPRHEKHEPTIRKEQRRPWIPIFKACGLSLAVAALALPLTAAVAYARWHVVVSTSPRIPQDVWFAGKGDNTDGWTSGGSICLNQLAQGFPNGEQVTLLLDIVEGGIVGEDGTPVAPGTYEFPGITEP